MPSTHINELDISTLIKSSIGNTSDPFSLDGYLLSDLQTKSSEIRSGFAMMPSKGSGCQFMGEELKVGARLWVFVAVEVEDRLGEIEVVHPS